MKVKTKERELLILRIEVQSIIYIFFAIAIANICKK